MKNKRDLGVKDILGLKSSLSEEFHSKTSINSLMGKTIPHEKWPENWEKVFYKEYPRFSSIRIEKGDIEKLESSLREVILKRRSERNFLNSPLKLDEIKTIIGLSAEINDINSENNLPLRSWPSAGARYPLELYIFNNKIEGLEKYSYHYNVKRSSLGKLFPLKNTSDFFVEVSGQKWTRNAACVIAISSVFGRNHVKYGDRGYRYSLIDCGHLGQNILLICTALGLKSCPIGGFLDTKLNESLELDGKNEAVIYLITIGN